MNAVVSTELYKDPSSYRELYMDNHFAAPDCFVMLKTQCKIVAYGTVHTNRKMWDLSYMDLAKQPERGASKSIIKRLLEYCLDSGKTIVI